MNTHDNLRYREDNAQNCEHCDKLKADNARYRAAIVAMTGEDKPEELARMENALNEVPIPHKERQNMLLAIRALIEIAP